MNNPVMSKIILMVSTLFPWFAVSAEAHFLIRDAISNERLRGVTVTLNVTTPSKDLWKWAPLTQRTEIAEDAKGGFNVSYAPDLQTSIHVYKAGYYPNSFPLSPKDDTRQRIFKLKPKVNPIPLIAIDFGRRPLQLDLEGKGTTKAFDCFKADWLPPYGHGNHADILFSLERYKVKERAFAAFKIKFVNEHDGLMPVETVYASNLPIREAPEKMQLIREMEIPLELTHEGYPSDFPKLKHYCFRVRTEKTPSGEILSAYYGKLYRAFSLDSLVGYGEFGFEYYFNPAPNDRNLEYNGEPLLKHKKSIQGIREIR